MKKLVVAAVIGVAITSPLAYMALNRAGAGAGTPLQRLQRIVSRAMHRMKSSNARVVLRDMEKILRGEAFGEQTVCGCACDETNYCPAPFEQTCGACWKNTDTNFPPTNSDLKICSTCASLGCSNNFNCTTENVDPDYSGTNCAGCGDFTAGSEDGRCITDCGQFFTETFTWEFCRSE